MRLKTLTKTACFCFVVSIFRACSYLWVCVVRLYYECSVMQRNFQNLFSQKDVLHVRRLESVAEINKWCATGCCNTILSSCLFSTFLARPDFARVQQRGWIQILICLRGWIQNVTCISKIRYELSHHMEARAHCPHIKHVKSQTHGITNEGKRQLERPRRR
jgi:hypothetical protein